MSHKGTSRGLQVVARFLVQYWLQNPRARDTLEGIHNWWLPQELKETTLDALLQSLEGLRERGWVREQRSRTGVVTYGIDPQRRPEIEDYLRRTA